MTSARSASASIEISLCEAENWGTPAMGYAASVASAASWSVVFLRLWVDPDLMRQNGMSWRSAYEASGMSLMSFVKCFCAERWYTCTARP